MTQALRDGVHRVIHAPLLLLGTAILVSASAATLELRLPLAGSSGPLPILGYAATLGGFFQRIDAPGGRAPLASAVVALAVGAFVVGGIIDRLARQEPLGLRGFLRVGRRCAGRLGRLAGLAGLAYGGLFLVAPPGAGADLRLTVTAETAEATGVIFRQLSFLGVLATLFGLNLVFDYAKIRAVVEDRRSMVGALLASARFVRRRPGDTIGLALVNVTAIGLIALVSARLQPEAMGGGSIRWAQVLVGQTLLVSQVFATLVLYASQVAYFQHELAHSRYVAASLPGPSRRSSGRSA